MKTIQTKNGIVKIFTDNIEQEALLQIMEVANSVLGENADIRIMPDVHVGKGCTIGTTMKISDKVCPNLVGVDIGCGVTLVETDVDFSKNLDKLDEVIRRNVPHGRNHHNKQMLEKDYFEKMKCSKFLKKDTIHLATLSLGSLGGGNHFIEAYDNGYLAVHSGSRNIGLTVAEYYQRLSEQHVQKTGVKIPKPLAFLEGQDMKDYLHDINIMQKFASENRDKMLEKILIGMRGRVKNRIDSIHNYIEIETKILRKGAISAKKGEELVIPLNMRDGMLVCKGLGNEDWNFSAPHGAGRVYSRSQAKQRLSLDEFKKEMKGIFSTCVNQHTLDEAPSAYKNMHNILREIKDTVTVRERLIPIYNFKAGGKD
ncbi:MAG: RtcB family protein [Firmicutes bacterium]|nr:RtcB family protein [Bacillota bacterium]